MQKERKTEIKVGITTILGLIVFIWIMAWAKNLVIAPSALEIDLIFDNVSGLEVGDQVTVNGLRKGIVRDISLNKNIILVKLSVDEDVDLRKDAKFWLATIDLMGDKKIEIEPGNSPEPLDLSLTHRGWFQPDLSSVMRMVGSYEQDIGSMVADLKTTVSALSNLMGDEELMSDLKKSVKNLNELTERLNNTLEANEQNISKITENTAELSEQTKLFFEENKESLQAYVTRLNSVLSESDSLLRNVNYLVMETSKGENNLGRFLYDDSLMINLTETIKRLKELSKIVKSQLLDEGLKVDANIF